ncbi:protein SDA1, partial [Trypanosoma grayi]|uniref:protein SDA1 n=1 Tax=Trypanosoma grayi TaxID=71804 RepID=UPI0004F3F523
MTEPAFRGTLLLLQNRTRRDPEAYRDEFLSQLDHFKALSKTIMTQQVFNPQYIAVLNYVCHVGHCFPKESEEVAETVLKLLQEFRGGAMTPELRLALVKSLALLRSKNIVSAERSFPLFFQLLQERDKSLRRLILSHIVSDVRKVNMPGAKNGSLVNKKAQNFLFGVMADDDAVQARCAEMVMIDLYRRRVWANERTVEVLTQACFSRHTAILRTALRFFLLQMPKIASLDDADDDAGEEADPGRAISKMKQKLKIVKKTSKRQRILKREMKSVKRKYDKEEKEEEMLAKQHVDPVRLLRNPQQFVERLLARLQKTTERFDVRILYLNVIARTVSEHEVVHLPLYAFLERYMEPSQLHATQLLALSVMCVHRMVPPDALEPLVKAIANHFVSDRASPDAITVGLNTIREICKRQPLAMNAVLLKDLAEYKSQRGDRGVMMAARALIQLYRDVYPELLPAKYRGSRSGTAEDKPAPVYGKEQVYTDVPGLDLLYAAMDEENGEESSCCGSRDDDDDDSDGTWMTDSSECDPDDVDGSFVDVSDCSSSDGDESD